MSEPKILIFDIENYDNQYKIYSDGKVWSEKSKRFLTSWVSSTGYLVVKISRKINGKTVARNVPLHKLLAEHFIPNPDNLETVNHKNKNKLDNSLKNLEWLSRIDNVKHGLQQVYKAISPKGEVVEFKGQAEFCRLNNLVQANFSNMLSGKRKICQGWTRHAS